MAQRAPPDQSRSIHALPGNSSRVPGRVQRIYVPSKITPSGSARNALRFSLDVLNVLAGETIAFEISNPGALPHEFYLGTAAEQQAHEREMATGPMHAGLYL